MTEPAIERSARIPPKEFAHLGVGQVAYIKSVVLEGVPAFAIHAADGAPLGVVREHAVAEAAVRELDLEPVSVH